MKMDDAKPRSGKDRVQLDDLVDMLHLKDGKWTTVRGLDLDILPVTRHWINIVSSKQKKEVKIPKICLAFDPSKDEKTDRECPYCEVAGDEVFYLGNFLIRDLQEDEPAKKKPLTKSEKKTGHKERGSESWTPNRVVRMPSSLLKKIQGLKELNKVKNKKTGKVARYSVFDAKFGRDIQIKYDSKSAGTDKYQVQLGDRTPLTDEELAFLTY
jgi:hypothetical protein